ncbi:class II aldolase/adducin family protein [Pseudomonas sp. UFMG81]|uniref:class II aldolase/adducin family protein n=1 Tax=Pseudomonas sp. UFMG81 TaxID=2745936 RepID=UPI001890762E|nr:class II aldolase/adducin family protein [Pseudomonas sp. UFMG81]
MSEPCAVADEVREYSAKLGAQPLLVQGAGGNVSWKDGEVLWVKASGTWLADALNQPIFVSVDLHQLRKGLAVQDFGIKPVVLDDAGLRPSIETLLHALMPQRIVVHVHAIDVLAHLVRADFPTSLNHASLPGMTWAAVGYYKPGAALAQAVAEALASTPDANVVFLQSHGVVVAGDTVAEIAAILETLTNKLSTVPRPVLPLGLMEHLPLSDARGNWKPASDPLLHQLSIDPVLFRRTQQDWALYPDHVVFLGPSAVTIDTPAAIGSLSGLPEILFIRGVGTFVAPGFNAAKQAQLRCYYDVVTRQAADESLRGLEEQEICELLDWDAERYRQQLAK